LRGEITPQPITKGPMGGHVDIAITSPNGDSTTTRQRMAARHTRKPYSFHFQQIPSPGSVVRVLYHEHSRDHGCVAAQATGEVS